MSLRGKTIVITRPRRQCSDLVQKLAERGAVVEAAPLIRTEPICNDDIDLQIAGLSRFRWIVFTSTNGVRYFRQRLSDLRVSLPETVRIAVIGSATAAVVRESGWKESLVPSRADSESLAAAFQAEPLAGELIALFVAERSRNILGLALEKQGASVTEIPLYRTLPDPAGVAALKQIRWCGTDAIIFMSGSAAEVFAASAPAGWREGNARLCAVGPVTKSRMQELGLSVDLVARDPSAKGVVEALEEGLNGR